MSRTKINRARDAVIEAARIWRSDSTGVSTSDLIRRAERLVAAVDAFDSMPLSTTVTHGAFPAGAQDTTREAARLAVPLQKSARRRIIAHVYGQMHLGADGCTDDEIQRSLILTHQTESAARNHLMGTGWIEDSGHRRPTRGRRDAIVWRLTPAALNQLREDAANAS